MRTWLASILFFCGVANASSWVSMKEAMNAFLWLKYDPRFPSIVLSENKNEIVFQVFDQTFSIRRNQNGFEILKNRQKATELHVSTVGKVLRFVKADLRSHAALSEDQFKESLRSLPVPKSEQVSSSVFQCKSALPPRRSGNGTVFHKIFSHTWLQNGWNESFGMPNTDEGTYFGGIAHVRTPDSFIGKSPKNLECAPVLVSRELDEKSVSEKIVCMARKMALPQDPVFGSEGLDQSWGVDLDYHALERNCLMATRFILECAGAKAPMNVNEGIGGRFKGSDSYFIHEISGKIKTDILGLRQELEELRSQDSLENLGEFAEKIITRGLELDARVRGVGVTSIQKNLEEICALLAQGCN